MPTAVKDMSALETRAELAIAKLMRAAGHVGDPKAAFHRAVAKHKAAGLDSSKATATVAREEPELHKAYLLSENMNSGHVIAVAQLLKQL